MRVFVFERGNFIFPSFTHSLSLLLSLNLSVCLSLSFSLSLPLCLPLSFCPSLPPSFSTLCLPLSISLSISISIYFLLSLRHSYTHFAYILISIQADRSGFWPLSSVARQKVMVAGTEVQIIKSEVKEGGAEGKIAEAINRYERLS